MTIESVTKEVEAIVDVAAPIVAAAVPQAAPIVAGVTSAESVVNAVEAAAPHNTAVAAIGAGVEALAATPIVQSNPQAQAYLGVASSFFAWLKTEFSKL